MDISVIMLCILKSYIHLRTTKLSHPGMVKCAYINNNDTNIWITLTGCYDDYVVVSASILTPS